MQYKLLTGIEPVTSSLPMKSFSWGRMREHPIILATMPPTTETDLKELRDLVIGLREEVRVGFAQVDMKFAQVETKLAQVDTKISDLRGEVNTRLAEMKGEIKIVKQPIEFWDFVKRSVAAGLTVTVVGGLLLAAWKLLIFGTLKV
jgi:hypothetical protein